MIFEGAPERPAEQLWLWRLFFAPVRAVVLGLIHIRVEGREHLPPRGPFVLVSNHISWKDPPLIAIALGLTVRYMAKVQAFDFPVLGFILRGIGSFPVRRGEGDRRALVTALRVLSAGQVLGYFPEGHRSESGALLRAKAGIGFLSKRAPEVPLVPIAMIGTRQPLLRLMFGRHAVLRVGRAFRLTDLSADERRDEQAIADAVMRRVAALVSDEMRGAYP